MGTLWSRLIVFLSHRFHRYTQIFSSSEFFSHADFADDADFFHHRMTRNLFGDFLLRRLLTEFRRCDLFGRCRYPLRSDKAIRLRFKKICVYLWNLWDKIIPRRKDTPWECKKSHRFHRFTQIFLGTFFKSRRFRRWRRFFSSSDATEFIRRFPAAAITHGISQRRPVWSLQIPSGIGQSDSPEIP